MKKSGAGNTNSSARRTIYIYMAYNQTHKAFAEEQQMLCLYREPEDGSASTEVIPG